MLDKNKRKYPRADVQLEVVVAGGEEGREYTVQAVNISAGGVCVSLPDFIAADTPVEMVVKLPDSGSPLETKGRIIWSLERRKLLKRKEPLFDTGIEFLELGQEERQRLIRFTQDILFR